jgi:hypothetical protein
MPQDGEPSLSLVSRDGKNMANAEGGQESLVVDREWADIPYFRKPFFLLVMIIVFMPAYLLMAWTGDIYYKKNGVVYKVGLKQKRLMTVVIVFLMASFLMREFAKP